MADIIEITKLKPHPKNSEIYGTEDDSDLVKSIKEHGLHNPIVVNNDFVIISGHRRYQAALEIGLTKVPYIVKQFDSEIDELEALILENAYRTLKTQEQRTREGLVLEKAPSAAYELIKIGLSNISQEDKEDLKTGKTTVNAIIKNINAKPITGESELQELESFREKANNFLSEINRYTELASALKKIPEDKRTVYVKAIQSIKDWTLQMESALTGMNENTPVDLVTESIGVNTYSVVDPNELKANGESILEEMKSAVKEAKQPKIKSDSMQNLINAIKEREKKMKSTKGAQNDN